MKIKELLDKVREGEIISDIDIQREIIYKLDKQRLVIDSVLNNIPLPAFYFWLNKEADYEVLDGKQRIYALERFRNNMFKYSNGKIWKQLNKEQQDKFLNTELYIITSQGNEKLKKDIFYRINTLGVPLSRFEVINGLYNGEYIRGLKQVVKQDKEIKKIYGSNSRGKNSFEILKLIGKIGKYKDIYNYLEINKNNSFNNDYNDIKPFIVFVSEIFNNYADKDILFKLAIENKREKNIWIDKKGEINKKINQYRNSDDIKLTKEKENDYKEIIQAILKGIKTDSKRIFTDKDKKELWNKNKGICKKCGKNVKWQYDELQVDHINPWSKGGQTTILNGQLLCRNHNIRKGNK